MCKWRIPNGADWEEIMFLGFFRLLAFLLGFRVREPSDFPGFQMRLGRWCAGGGGQYFRSLLVGCLV